MTAMMLAARTKGSLSGMRLGISAGVSPPGPLAASRPLSAMRPSSPSAVPYGLADKFLEEIDCRSDAQHKRIAVGWSCVSARSDDVLRIEFQIQPGSRLPPIPGFRYILAALRIARSDAQRVGEDLRIGHIRIDVRCADSNPVSILRPPGPQAILHDTTHELIVLH